MRSSDVGRTLVTSLIAFGIGLAVLPTASADPSDPAQTGAPAPAPPANAAPAPAPPPDGVPVADGPNPGTADACKQFAVAMQYAASHYEDFAYDTAGNGNSVDYGSPIVASDNATGRTALRQAAAAAMSASTTPGVPPDISAPMQSWSMHAAQLILVMGLHGGGDALNSTATDMNTDGHNAQLACAAAGVKAA